MRVLTRVLSAPARLQGRNCGVWQHGDCLGIGPSAQANNFLCEQCRWGAARGRPASAPSPRCIWPAAAAAPSCPPPQLSLACGVIAAPPPCCRARLADPFWEVVEQILPPSRLKHMVRRRSASKPHACWLGGLPGTCIALSPRRLACTAPHRSPAPLRSPPVPAAGAAAGADGGGHAGGAVRRPHLLPEPAAAGPRAARPAELARAGGGSGVGAVGDILQVGAGRGAAGWQASEASTGCRSSPCHGFDTLLTAALTHCDVHAAFLLCCRPAACRWATRWRCVTTGPGMWTCASTPCPTGVAGGATGGRGGGCLEPGGAAALRLPRRERPASAAHSSVPRLPSCCVTWLLY